MKDGRGGEGLEFDEASIVTSPVWRLDAAHDQSAFAGMTSGRSAALQAFLDALKLGFGPAETAGLPAAAFVPQLFSALAVPAVAGQGVPSHPPVCQHLPAACGMARVASPELARLIAAFERLFPQLSWKPRASGGPQASANWPDGHANAVIVGSGGLEERSDVAIGASLLAPQVRYPDHTHPPEELYLALTPGRFQHGDSAWCEPGAGGTFHNPPGIVHAMASGDAPLLAIWTMIVREA
jgi:quercetin dioxygenase-like cupin family protein